MPPSRPDARWSTGKWIAAILAVAVHLAFIVFLVFNVTWQNRKPEAVSVELYAPPAPQKVEPVKTRPPEPEPPKPPPKVEPPQPTRAEIALKDKQEQERRKKEQLDRERLEKEKKDADKREAEKRDAEKRKAEDKHLAEARERQAREADALKAQADRDRLAQQKAADTARAAADADYVSRIQTKIKGYVIVPSDIASNPEAIFDVVQLPTGEIIDVQLKKSSGVRAYDEAVQRAIIKSSPLPRPASPEMFRRNLTLKFRPLG